MAGRSTSGGSIVGLAVAAVAVVGWITYDWEFAGGDGIVPLATGAVVAR